METKRENVNIYVEYSNRMSPIPTRPICNTENFRENTGQSESAYRQDVSHVSPSEKK